MNIIFHEQIKRGSAEAKAVARIQEQYKKFFFVPFSQLERAVEDGHILVAVLDSEVVGYAWSFTNDGVVRIRYVATDKAYSRRGIGRALAKR